MKYLKLRVIEPSLNMDFSKNSESFTFDEDEEIEDFDERILSASDFTYELNTIYLNCYRISTIETTSINGVNVSIIKLGHKHIVISYLSPAQLFTMINTEGSQIEHTKDDKEEKKILKKINTHKDIN